MSHSPESHHSHHEKVIGPDEDGFKWPNVEKVDSEGNSHRAVHPTTYETTHRYPDGHYYTINENKDVSRAGNRLYEESHVKEPLKYGLYRTGEHGAPIRPESPNHDDTALDRGAFVFNENGVGSRSNNEQRDIDARATPIIASYEARDRALKEGKSMEEAQAIGADVYNIHFGMAGTPTAEESTTYPGLPSGSAHPQEQLPNGPTEPQAQHRKFGHAATEGAFRSPRSETNKNTFEEATGFLNDVRVQYSKDKAAGRNKEYKMSSWLEQISAEDMQTIINEVRAKRAEWVNKGVTDKALQDKRIYRDYRMQLETTQDSNDPIKKTHGVLWDLMRDNPNGSIPF